MQSSKHDTPTTVQQQCFPALAYRQPDCQGKTHKTLVTLLNYWLMDSGENQSVSSLVPTGEPSRFQEIVENPWALQPGLYECP